MSVFASLWALLGWRGAAGLGAGVALASALAYPAGRVVERAACEERIERRLAQHTIKELELLNERTDTALAARRRAERDGAVLDGRGLPDDGYRRD